MNRPFFLPVVGLAALATGTVCFCDGPPGTGTIDGASLEMNFAETGGSFVDFVALNFSSEDELDCVSLYDSKAYLMYRPGRYDAAYLLANNARAIAAVPGQNGRDGLLVADGAGLQLLQWGDNSSSFFSSLTLATAGWSTVERLWAFPWGSGTTRVFGFDGIDTLYVGDYSITTNGSAFDEGTSITAGTSLVDLESFEWSLGFPGPELVFQFSSTLEIRSGDGDVTVATTGMSSDSRMGVSRNANTGVSLLAFTYSWAGQTYLVGVTTDQTLGPIAVGSSAPSDLITFDRDGDGVEDVLLTSGVVPEPSRIFRRVLGGFVPFSDGDCLVVTETGRIEPFPEPITVGTSGDFDNDGSIDLYFGHGASRVTQYITRPFYEDWLRMHHPVGAPEPVIMPNTSTGKDTLLLQLAGPEVQVANEYHVQVYVQEFSPGGPGFVPGSLESTPRLDDYFPLDFDLEAVSLEYDNTGLPAYYALILFVSQVDRSGAQDLHYTIKTLSYSQTPGINEYNYSIPQPTVTGPIDPENGTGTRTGGRTGTGAGPPPP